MPLILHICGKTLDRMDYIAQNNMSMFHFDSRNDPAEAKEIVGDRIGLVGNINNPVTLYSKGPEEVRAEVNRCLDAGIDMIAPECAIPLATKLENLLEIPKAVRDWCEERQSTGGGASPPRHDAACLDYRAQIRALFRHAFSTLDTASESWSGDAEPRPEQPHVNQPELKLMSRVVSAPEDFTIVGENIHATRVLLRKGTQGQNTGRRHGVRCRSEGGEWPAAAVSQCPSGSGPPSHTNRARSSTS